MSLAKRLVFFHGLNCFTQGFRFGVLTGLPALILADRRPLLVVLAPVFGQVRTRDDLARCP